MPLLLYLHTTEETADATLCCARELTPDLSPLNSTSHSEVGLNERGLATETVASGTIHTVVLWLLLTF